jgi:RimJ/RimL family protein N-acetyltransferase
MSTPDWPLISLTPVAAADATQLNAWQNDAEIRDQIMGFRGPVRLETTQTWIANVNEQNLKTRAVFAIRRAGELAGVVQLHSIDWVQRTAMLGVYVGAAGDRGAGLGGAATSLILDYAFNGLDLHRVGLETLASNAAARGLYERLGFIAEGVLREAFLRGGRREDVALYGLLKPEWTTVLPAGANRLVS